VNKIDFAEQLITEAKKLGATAAEVMMGESAEIMVSCRNGELEDIERSENSGLGLRVFVGKKTANISSSKFDDAKTLAERAVFMAQKAPADEHSELADTGMFPKEILDLDLYDPKEPSAESLIELAKKAEATALENGKISNSEGGDANYSDYISTLITSEGFKQTARASRCGLSVRVLAGDGVDMQRDYDYSSARYMADLTAPEIIGKNAAEKTVAKLHSRKIPTGKYTVFFDPRVSKNFVSDLANGVNGAAITRGTSYLKNMMDEKIFAENISIIDDPHIKRGIGSRPYDAEGVKNAKLKIIENGVLKTWLLDIRSANQLKLKTNGRAARGMGSPSSPSSTNLYMENGKISPQDLLKSVPNGLYITDTFGMGINYVTGDYSQGASGFWVENGEKIYPVNEITLAGNLLEIFKNIVPANDLEFKYSTNAPTLMVPAMTIAGS
jgi:PmbA protein